MTGFRLWKSPKAANGKKPRTNRKKKKQEMNGKSEAPGKKGEKPNT
jgi:hypothetical protein